MKVTLIKQACLSLLLAMLLTSGASVCADYCQFEVKEIKASLTELEKYGVTIIPTPKQVKFHAKNVIVPVKAVQKKIFFIANNKCTAALDYINKKLKKLDCPPLLEASNTGNKSDALYLVLTSKEQHPELFTGQVKDKAQGYVIKKQGNRIFLAGNDKSGILYAAVTYAQLIKKQNNKIIFPDVEIYDWADCLYRQIGSLEWPYRKVFRWKQTSGLQGMEDYLDHALTYKINMLFGPSAYGKGHPIGYKQPKIMKWLQAANKYAKARNIRLVLSESVAVGFAKENKNNPEFKDCIEHYHKLFTWSNDKLLKAKREKLKNFLVKSGYEVLFLHSLDTTNSKWHCRSNEDRFRFGADRMKADAHVFNLYYKLKQEVPGLNLIFVPRPYHGNLDKVSRLIAKSELRRPDDMKRFSKRIPADVHIDWRESNPASIKALRKTLRQSLHIYQASSWGQYFLYSRPLKANFFYTRTFIRPFSKDIFFYACGGWPDNSITAICGAEYSWNMFAPGSREFTIDDAYAKKTAKGSKIWQNMWEPFSTDKNIDVKKSVIRACESFYGKKYASYFLKIFTRFIDYSLVFKPRKTLLQLKKYKINLSDEEFKKQMQLTCDNSEAVVKDLEKLQKVDPKDSNVRAAMKFFMLRHILINTGAKVNLLLMDAESLLDAGKIQAAAQKCKQARQALKSGIASIKSKAQQIQYSKNDYYLPATAHLISTLTPQRTKLVLLESRLPIKSGNSKPQKKDKSSIVKVGIFNPKSMGGKVYGAQSIMLLLKSILDIKAVFIKNISAKDINNFDCIIIPDCKSIGNSKFDLAALNRYVNQGGAVYLEHDSCGHPRFAFEQSLYPRIAKYKKTVVSGKKNKKITLTDSGAKIIGLLSGVKYDHKYSDHHQLLKGPDGICFAHDNSNKPVIVGGKKGNGKVLLSGCITFGRNDKEMQSAPGGVEASLITSGIYWLTDKKGIEINCRIERNDEVDEDGIYTYLDILPSINFPPNLKLKHAEIKINIRDAESFKVLKSFVFKKKISLKNNKWQPKSSFNIQLPVAKDIFIEFILLNNNKIKTKYFVALKQH